MILLFFGQPASGKTTLAREYIKESYLAWKSNLTNNCIPTYIHLDGDEWRDITKNVDYSKEGRIRNLKGAFDMALYLEKKGFIPVLSFVAPYEELRQYLYENSKSLVQIYLRYNEDRGRTQFFAKDFEEPLGSCLTISTSLLTINECLAKIQNYVNVE